MDVTPELLKQYFTTNKRRASYKDATDKYNDLRIHFNGETPTKLIYERRPSETNDLLAYRKQIYEPVTIEACSAVTRSLGKIRRSPDWTIKYPQGDEPAQIAEDESLEDYCEYNFPLGKSVTNWSFSILLKNLLIDTNSVILIVPQNEDAEANEYLQPIPIIFNSDRVYEYIPNQLAVLLSTETTEKYKGKIFIVVDAETKTVQRWEQKGNTTDFLNTQTYTYPIEDFPCFRMPGIFEKMYGTNDVLTVSHIQPMVPRLNEAAREYSDMQASIVTYLFPESWEYASQKCEECAGTGFIQGVSTGKIKGGNGKRTVTCTKCNGTASIITGPLRRMVLRSDIKTNMGEVPIPSPPKGWLEKNTNIVELQDKRISDHIFRSLASINMQFLAQTPLTQSGIAKSVDKDELNNFVYGIAEDIVKVMDMVYYFCNEYRYYFIVPNEKARKALVPVIPVPEKYDIVTGVDLTEELKGIKDAQVTSALMIEKEFEFTNKVFASEPDVRNRLECFYSLDPLPGVNEDEKLTRLQAGGITEQDYVISSNIVPFIRMAFFENEDFNELPFDKQQAKMVEYATAKMKIIADAESAKMKAAAEAMAKTIPPAPPARPE